MRPIFLLLLLLAAAGCAADDDDSAEEPTPEPTLSGFGTLAISFGIDEHWRDGMDEPAVGPFWGTIYRSEQVTAAGPDDGAEELGSVHVETVDLTGDTLSTDVVFHSGDLPAGWVTILGFLDSDGNSTEEDRGPDARDPVTLPNRNEFEVLSDVESPAQIWFSFLNPSS